MTLNVKRLDDISMVELPEILARTEMPDTAPLWDDLKKARLIDSILNNIPIGQIFLMRQPRQIAAGRLVAGVFCYRRLRATQCHCGLYRRKTSAGERLRVLRE